MEFEKTPSTTSSTASSMRTSSIHHLETTDSSADADAHVLLSREQLPPPQYPASEASSPRPPPFSSLFSPLHDAHERPAQPLLSLPREKHRAPQPLPGRHTNPRHRSRRNPSTRTRPPGLSAIPSPRPSARSSGTPRGTRVARDDAEPPPAYSDGDSPLVSFSYLMAAAGGASSIITQVQQAGPPVNTIGGELHIVIPRAETTRG